MKKQTAYFIIGIGIASMLAGIYSAFKSGQWMDSISGVFIGAALIGTVIYERNKKDESE